MKMKNPMRMKRKTKSNLPEILKLKAVSDEAAFFLDGCNTFLVPETDNLGIEKVLRGVKYLFSTQNGQKRY